MTPRLLSRIPARIAITIVLVAHGGAIHAQAIPKSGPIPRNAAREEALVKQVRAPTGFAVSLFAGPPVAMYPTCVTTSPDGSVYACIDGNLSLSADKGRGRVVRLVDEDNDGKADSYSVFAEMDSPRGIIADGRNVYVMHPPTLTAYRDTTGDGIADVSEDLVRDLGKDLAFRGADHTTNGIALGIDGWIYIAVGDYSFQQAVGKDGRTIGYRGGSVVRVRPDGTGLEIYAVGTRNTYDVAVDPFLHVFSRDNTNDGDGWDTRLHYLPRGANMGYPTLYKNFADEHMPSLADYGAGAGTGDLWVHDPGFPDGFANTLYTADWTLNKVFRHPLTRKGATFTPEQIEFLTIPHPTDMAMDLRSNMYVSSLYAGQFNYAGDSVGYIVRISHPGRPATRPPLFATMTATQLVAAIGSPNSVTRLGAQRELLRRPLTTTAKSTVTRALTTMVSDVSRAAYARVAAMHTLRQVAGAGARPTILRAAAQPSMRAAALRALVDDETQLTGIDAALYVRSLRDTNPEVQVQAISGLVRLGARNEAGAIVPLTASPDAAVAHIAVNALVALKAADAAFGGVDKGAPAVRRGALRAVAQLHDSSVVAELLSRSAKATDPAVQSDLLAALARLHSREAPWKGEWWGTRPSFIGPYFAPVAWEVSPGIRSALRDGLLAFASRDTAELGKLVSIYSRNRVLPVGAGALVVALGAARDSRVGALADALIGTSELATAALPLLAQIDSTSAAFHLGVARLLAGETRLPLEAIPLARAAILDATLTAEARRDLLNAISRIPGQPGLDAIVPLFAAATPADTTSGPVETAWRRFVGERRRTDELDYFIGQARTGPPAHRTLAFSVLIQAVRPARTAQTVRAKVTPVIDSAWSDPVAAPHLVAAIRVMRLEAAYADRLAANRGEASKSSPQEPREWVQLFNGRDLTNWDIKFTGRPLNENFNNTFRVENGMLQVRYDQWTAFNSEWGHLFYNRPFSHYVVAVEYRFVGEQVAGAGARNSWAIRNNGVMVHSQSAASMGERQDFPISLEVQLLGGLGTGRRTTGNLCTPGTHVMMGERLVTAHCTNSTSQTYDGDQWVRAEVLVLGDSLIKHIVNGDTVLTYGKPRMGGGNVSNTTPGVFVDGKMLAEGFIALQAESAPIDFRKVEIVNLVGCMDPRAANYRAYYVKADPASCRPR
jgi:glucose/arabinose dehydrogenase